MILAICFPPLLEQTYTLQKRKPFIVATTAKFWKKPEPSCTLAKTTTL